jgi:LPS-assembly protein
VVIQRALLIWVLLWAISSVQISHGGQKSIGDRLSADDDGPWNISAGTLSYNEDQGVYHAQGDVVISKGGVTLHAQRVTYSTQTGIAHVWGDVKMESEGDVLTGDQGLFNLRDHTGKIEKGRLFLKSNHYYIIGEVMEKEGKDTYLVKDCHLTTCDGEDPAWSLTGSEVRVTIEGYGKVKHAALRVKDWPLLYFPYFVFPAKTKRQSGLLPPRFGYSSRNGLDAEIPFFWAISDQTDATFYQRYMDKRGYMQGVEFRYIAGEASKGAFLFDILSDKKEEKDLNDPDEVEISPFARNNQTRYWFRGKADQDLFLGWSARLDADFVSDQDYLREFDEGGLGLETRPDLVDDWGRPVEEEVSPTRRSALRLAHDGDDYSLQALASYHQRPENPSLDDTAQPLGGLNFLLLPQQVFGWPLYFNIGSDYGYVWRDTGQKGHRISIVPEIKIPLWLGPHIECEPFFQYSHNSQWFEEEGEEEDHQNRRAYEAGLRLATNVERVFDPGWQNVKRLKHKIRPTLEYSYRAYQDKEDEEPWFESIDQEGDANLVTLSFENFLDARMEDKKGNITYRQWGTFTVSQTYDIEEARRDQDPDYDREPFKPLKADISLNPFPNLDFSGVAYWDHYDNRITSADLSLELIVDRSGNRKDLFEVDYQYERDTDKNLSLSVDLNLLYGFSTGGSLEKDLMVDQDISKSLWLEYESQCWAVRLGAEWEDEDTQVMIVFRLLGLGDFKTRKSIETD